MRRPRLGVPLLLALALAAAAPVGAQPASDLDEATRELASALRCPVCQGVSIQDSPTELAREMKGVIHAQLEAGRTPDQVRAYFVERYGEWVLLEPEARGFNLVVYLLPLLGLLVGGVLVGGMVRRWTRLASPDADLVRLLKDVPEREEP
jgi:cytochrome c-type biogenesis protein CcmH